MTTLKLQGDGAGGGSITISPTNTTSNRTVTLPDADVTVPSGLPDAQAKFSSNVLTAEADLLYASAANTLARLAKGTAAQTLRMNSGATAPEWVTRFAARAWASIDGDAGTLAFHAEEGFASIVDSGTGNYQANLDSALADTNGTIVTNTKIISTGSQQWTIVACSFASEIQIQVSARLVYNDAASFAAADMDPVMLAVFR